MKKWIAALLTIFALSTLLTGCMKSPLPAEPSDSQPSSSQTESSLNESSASEKEYIPGVRTEKDYTSEVLGLKFTLTDTMVMATDEEILNMMQAGADLYEDSAAGQQMLDYSKISSVYEMMAVDSATGGNVMVVAEKLPFSSMTEEQYIASVKRQYEQTAVEVEYEEVTKTTLGKAEFTNLSYVMTVDGVKANQTMLFKKLGNLMYAVSLTYYSEDGYNQLLNSFSGI